MIHLKATCDQRRAKKDGTHPIVFRITVNGKSRDVSSGLSCYSRYWDYKKGVIRDKQSDLKILANRLTDMKLDLLKKIRKFELESSFGYDVQDVRNYLCNVRKRSNTLREFWQYEIDRLKTAQNFSNARNYYSAYLGFNKITSLDIPLEKINYTWLLNAETKMRENGLKPNSIAVYYRELRALYNRAINEDLVDYNLYPFRRYKIQNGSSVPRSLTIEEMRKFFRYVPTSMELRDAHDLGKLIFLLRGMNYTDLALSKTENVRNGRFIYQRSKTKKIYNVKLLPEAQSILEAHSSEVQNLLLNILSEKEYADKQNLPMCICQKRKVLNNRLKKIGIALGINEPLSTYVFRYSHANICRVLGYSKDLISQSLGHSYGLRVTTIYLNDYDMKVIDQMNKHVVSEVMKEG